MLWVVTFSVFLPSLTSSSLVWANPSPAQKPSSVAHSQSFFMIGLAWLKFMTPKTLAYTREIQHIASYFPDAGGPRGVHCVHVASSYLFGLPGLDSPHQHTRDRT